jgi:hypothetical protein
LAKKNNNGESAGKSKKRTVTPGAKHVAKPRQIISTASRKPTGAFLVKGRVMTTDGPLAGVLVRAVDQDRRGEDLLGEVTTDQDGNYKVTYSESQFRRTEKEIGGPDLIVRVYSAEGKVMAQSKRKRNAGRKEIVDLTVSNEQQFVVSGTVRRSDDQPAAGALIRAYDQDLRKKQLLGKATADAKGHYSISYTSRKFLVAEKTGADLYVVVVNAQHKELVSSEVLFNAPVEAVVDLTLPPDGQTLSEFELLLADILPLLAGQGKGGANLKIAELEEKDIAFLSRESGQPQERIAFLLAAVKAVLAAPLEKPADQVLLTAVEFPGGHLDWYSFDERTDQKLNRDVTVKQNIFNLATIPTALSFRGMPATRLWEFEDAQVRFGSIQAVSTDLARLLLVEFLIEYGYDFCISNKPLFRVFSLRHEFPIEFHCLLHSPINTEISIKLSEKFFPIFSPGRTMQISLAKLALGTPKNQTVSNFKISINNSERTSFTSDPLLGGLPTNQNLEALFVAGNKTELKFKLKNAGNLAPTPPVVGDSSPISPDKLLDLLIYLEYKITS